ncbi:MAG TPA: histidine phosphatase family protein [Spirochaetales bacterium]|nr:histidine phosphatase family protein [Spirochaetales bacterium]
MEHDDRADAFGFGLLTHACNFYIVRHGESVANAQNRIQGRSDFPLNERGRQQATACGAWFAGKNVKAVLCSPLSRAMESAQILCAAASFPPPKPEELLLELETGRFSGLTLAEAKELHPEDHARFLYQSWEGVEDAERSHQLVLRAHKAWHALVYAALHCGGDVIALSHGGLIQWLVRTTFGASSWLPLVPTGNCCVYQLLVEPRGRQPDGRPAVMLQWKEMNYLPPLEHARAEPVF